MLYACLLRIWRNLPKSYRFRWSLIWALVQKFLVGVAGVVLNAQGEILLVNHTYRKEYSWGLPGGWLKRGEQPAEALKREIAEETGLRIEILHPLAIHADQRWPRLDVIFLCRYTGGEMRPSAEVSEARFYRLDETTALLGEQAHDIRALLEADRAS